MAFTARTETYVNLASLTTPYDITVTKPTGTVDGDILFCWIGWFFIGTRTIDAVPAGWTLLGEYTANIDKYALYYKIAASEPSSWIWSLSDSCKVRAVCSCYTGGDFAPADPIDVVSNTVYRVNDTACIAASMTVSAVNSPLIFWGGTYYSAAVLTFIKPSVPSSDWIEDDDAGNDVSDFSTEVCSMIWSGSGATGDMSATMSLSRSYKHAFAVALNPSAYVTPQAVSGALSFAGSLSTARIRIVSEGGSLSPTGALSRFISKNTQGSLSFAGITHLQTFKSLAGTLTSSGALTRFTQKLISGALSPVGTLIKMTQKPLDGILNSVGDLTKNISKIISGVLSSSGALTPSKIFIQAVGGVLSFAGEVAAQIVTTTKVAVGGVLSLVGSVSTIKIYVVDLMGYLSSSGEVIKQTSKNLIGGLTSSGVLTAGKVILMAIGGVLTLAGSLVKNMSKNVEGLIKPVGIVSKYTRKLMHGTLTFSGSLKKMTSKIMSGVLSFIGILSRPGRDLTMKLFNRPYRDISVQSKPYRDMTVESKED